MGTLFLTKEERIYKGAKTASSINGSGKTGRTGIQIDLFRRKCYEINVLHLSILRKALESLTEKAMAPHSSTLPWKIPWMEKPGGLQSMGSQRVRHD